MTDPLNLHTSKVPEAAAGVKDFQTFYFSELLKRPVCAGKIDHRLGRLSDLVFRVADPYPEALGIYMDFGWGKPTQFVPWDRVVKIDDDAIFVQPPPEGGVYPPFVDQPGLLLVNEHLIGQTILDMDGRRTEIVNDVHLLATKGHMLIVHVDVSFNGFLRRWHLGRIHWLKDAFVNWRYVQPLSVEDTATATVSLSISRKQMKELPSEDLADILETLSGPEQQAVFQALDSEKAAETLVEAEPRAQRQIIANLRQERARTILSEMSAAQLAVLFAVLPHDDRTELTALLPKDQADKVAAMLSEREATAKLLMSAEFVTMEKETPVGDALRQLRASGATHSMISYIYIISQIEKLLLGVVDIRDLVLAPDQQTLGDLMTSPVVSADESDTREDLSDLFAKYHYRMVPVVDAHDHLLGVVHYNDVMKGLVTRART